VHGRSRLSVPDRFQVDAAHLRRAPSCTDCAVQAEGVCQVPLEDASQSVVGHRKEFILLGRARRHLLW
jgi:hypothetical protein